MKKGDPPPPLVGSNVPSADMPLPQPGEVLGVAECQVGLGNEVTTPWLGSEGMSTCTCALLKNEENGRVMVLHVTEGAEMETAFPALAQLLDVQNAEALKGADLKKAVQDRLAAMGDGAISLTTVAGPVAQGRYNPTDGLPSAGTDSVHRTLNFMAELDPGDKVNHQGHTVATDFVYKPETATLFRNIEVAKAGFPKEQTFAPGDYDWGPYCEPTCAELKSTDKKQFGNISALNKLVRQDGLKVDQFFVVRDDLHPNELQQSQRATAAKIIAAQAVEEAFKGGPDLSEGRKQRIAAMIEDHLNQLDLPDGDRFLQKAVVDGYHLSESRGDTKIAAENIQVLEGRSLAAKLGKMTQQFQQGHSELAQEPGALRRFFDSGRQGKVAAANQAFSAALGVVTDDHSTGEGQDDLEMAVEEGVQAQGPDPGKPTLRQSNPELAAALSASGSLRQSKGITPPS